MNLFLIEADSGSVWDFLHYYNCMQRNKEGRWRHTEAQLVLVSRSYTNQFDCNKPGWPAILWVIIFAKHKITVVSMYYYVQVSGLWDTGRFYQTIRRIMISKQDLYVPHMLNVYPSEWKHLSLWLWKMNSVLTAVASCLNGQALCGQPVTCFVITDMPLVQVQPCTYWCKASFNWWGLPRKDVLRGFHQVLMIRFL